MGRTDDDTSSLLRMAGLATPMALRVAVTLDLPKRLRDAASAAILADELHVNAVALGLLLEHLATLDILERTGDGFRTTAYGSNLCDDNLITTLLRLDTAGGRAELAFVELAHSVATGEAAYPRRYGAGFWADLAEHPHLRESFDRQMTLRIRAQLPHLVAAFEWSRFDSLVDVGGGNGEVLAAILAAHPRMRGHLVDLDSTAALATFRAHDLAERTQATASSFFDPLPLGADAYLLVDILHNWEDAHAGRILARCAEAAGPTGCILVVEHVADRGTNTELNLSMLTMFGGRDRHVAELESLAAPQGLTLDDAIDLTSERSLLEFRRTAG
ncbi:methyltransferase [Amycolatopsis sp. FDAARGOS 1241]|uniref:methyltransferase n=1 Tax=Amycolatopsis sp. FDAARGOS 1241 TaxID=2778070 RepID=UPI001EF36924|nr:methyltransferase [Amycolatopsis sp. FDAARGOS 1241]